MCKSPWPSHCSLWISTLQLDSVILNYSKHIVHEYGLKAEQCNAMPWRASRLSTLGLRSEDIESLFHLLVKLNPQWIVAIVETSLQISKFVNIHLSSSFLTLRQCVYSIQYSIHCRQERLRQTCFVHTVWRLRRVCSLRQVHKEEPQVHYAPGLDLLAGFAKQTLQKLAYVAWHREVSNFLFWGPAKSVAFVNC